jgi:hypothetical protein
MAHPLPPDKAAGYLGLVGGLVAILVTVFTIVQLTKRSLESHAATSHGSAPAEATTPAPR